MRSTAKRFPWLYLFLSYALAWVFWIPVTLIGVNYQSSPFLIVLVFTGVSGPGIAGIIMTRVEEGKEGMVDFWRRAYGVRRVRPVWWVIPFTLWPALHLIAIAINSAAGGGLPEFSLIRDSLRQAASLPVIVVLYFVQAGLEQLGWRGYMLEKLQKSMKPAGASLAVGICHAVWHIPLFLVTGTNQYKWGFGVEFWIFILVVTASSFYSTWCYNSNNRSTFAVIVLHTTVNLSLDIFMGPALQMRIYNALIIAGAAAIAAVWLIQRGTAEKKNQDPQERGGTNE